MHFNRIPFSARTARLLAGLVLVVILVAPALAAPSAPAVFQVIDEFDTQIMGLTAQKDQPPAMSSLPNGGGDATILGGQRDIMATVTESSFPQFYKMNVVVVGGQLSMSQDTSVKGTVLVTWDGPDNDAGTLNPVGLNHHDLTANSQVQFGVQVVSDDRPANLVLTVYTDGSNYSTYTLWLPGNITQPTVYMIPYSAFTPAAGSGATFSNVGAVTMMIDGTLNQDTDVTVSWVKTSDSDPLAATLGDFGVTAQAQDMLVSWETVSELGNAGFNVWRSTSAASPELQLNATMIPSQAPGSSQGFLYTWPDNQNLVGGTRYYYWLETVDGNGHANRYGPVSEVFNLPTAVHLDDVVAGQSDTAPAGLGFVFLFLATLTLLWRRHTLRAPAD